MRLVIVDGNGIEQTVIAQSVETPVDASGVLAGAGSQPLLAANPLRAGWLFLNDSAHVMRINELGGDATAAGAWIVPAGGYFPPPGYPVTVGQINISGTNADAYTVREWSTPA